MEVKLHVLALAVFGVAFVISRAYRLAGGAWVPGWTGGIGLLLLFFVFFVSGFVLGWPSWLEPAFLAVVGAWIGAYLNLAKPTLGAWWRIWQ
jgi:hypothetical protein